ncbi:MAG: tyrosine-protein kinase family protein [Proteobacteria bacterium]|nr:tyrosine-protein kinase family protein [Pseudomonadota bacterium]
MNTIEQAAKRLEQLRRAGVDIQADAAAAQQPPHRVATEPAPAAPPDDRRSREVSVDLARMRHAGLLVPGQPRSQLEEEFRIVKRPLLENVRNHSAMRPERANLIMVSSAVPGEGKTQTALNLAVSIAMELDHTVLLVEADVLRPSALDRLGVTASKGLLDLLESPQTDLAEVLLRTNIPKLTLLPAGTASSRSTELLASDAMTRLLEELASKYSDRVVIFDSPPLLATSEARVLAGLMGQIVVVVCANRTPRQAVLEAIDTLDPEKAINLIFNQASSDYDGSAYGRYGDAYGYEHRQRTDGS